MDLEKLLGGGSNGAKPDDKEGAKLTLAAVEAMFTKLGTALNAKIEKVQSDLATQVHNIDKNVGKLRGMVKGADAQSGDDQTGGSDSKSSAANPPGLKASDVQDQVLASMQLGSMMSKLPKKARSQLEARLAKGETSISEMLSTVELLVSMQDGDEKSNGDNGKGADDKTVITGDGGTPPQVKGAPAFPASQAEYVALAAKDPDRFNELNANPDFDPYALP